MAIDDEWKGYLSRNGFIDSWNVLPVYCALTTDKSVNTIQGFPEIIKPRVIEYKCDNK